MSDKTERSVTSEEIEQWRDEHDEPHPVFEVDHRPERETLADKPVGLKRTECWNCGHARLIYEACPECGRLGSGAPNGGPQ